MDSESLTRILSIKQKKDDIWEVVLSIGQKPYHFTFTIEKDVDEPKFLNIVEEPEFSQLFKYNIHIASEILKLIIKEIKREKSNYPVEVGLFYSFEQSLAQQQPFNPLLVS